MAISVTWWSTGNRPIGCRPFPSSSMGNRLHYGRAPEHGEDTEAVLVELGYDWDEIIGLKEAEVIL